jgi:hypothetical protein
MPGVKDIAAAMLYAESQPPRVNVNILTLYPTQQETYSPSPVAVDCPVWQLVRRTD